MPLGMRNIATRPAAVSKMVVKTIRPKYGRAIDTKLMPPRRLIGFG